MLTYQHQECGHTFERTKIGDSCDGLLLRSRLYSLERPDLACEVGAVDRLDQGAKQLGRFLGHIRSSGLETVHQKAVALIVVVEDPSQVLSGRQAPVPLQLGRNCSPVDGCDPMIFHSGNGILGL
jgi:hypothetical protein